MPISSQTDAWPTAPGVHQGRPACIDLLRRSLLALDPANAPGQPALAAARQVWLVDPRFEHWPLDEAPVQAALAAWLRQGGRRLSLIGEDFDATARALPRFARWRRDWMHTIEVHQPVEGPVPGVLRGLLAGQFGLQRLDAPDWRFRVFTDLVQLQAAEGQIADFLQRCEPSWPATTLGL